MLSTERFDFIHTCKYLHIYHSGSEFMPRIGCSNKIMDTRMHYIVLGWTFFLLFPLGTLLWNRIFVREETRQTLSLSEASLRLSSDFIHKSVWGIRIYLWNECLIFYSHLVFLQQFMSLWITVFCKSCAVSCKNLWMENVGSVVLLLHILQRQNDDLIYFKSASWDSSSNGNGRTFSQATCNQCKIRKLSSFLIGRLWKFWSFAKYSCYWFAILTGVCFSFKEEPGKR